MHQPTYPQNNAPRTRVAGLTRLENAPPAFANQKYSCMEKQLWPKYNSCFRILPGWDPATGAIYPQILDPSVVHDATNPGIHLSDTFYSVRMIDTFGRKGAAIIAQLDPTSDEASLIPYAPFESFANIVQASVDGAKKGRKLKPLDCWKTWRSLTDGILGWVSTGILMQVVGAVVNDDWFSGDPNQQVAYGVVYLTHGPSKEVFLQTLTMPQNSRLDLNPTTNSNLGPVAEQNGIWTYMNAMNQRDEKGKDHFYLQPAYYPPGANPRTATPAADNLTADFIRSTWVPWNKLLKFYTIAEQFRILAQTFGADSVNYVFNGLESEPYIPMDVRQQGLGRYATLNNHDVGAPRTRISTASLMPPVLTGVTAQQFATPQATPAPAAPAYATAPAAPAPQYAPPPVAPPPPQYAPAVPPAYAAPVTGEPVPYVRQQPTTAVPPQVQAAMDAAMVAGVRVQGTPPPAPAYAAAPATPASAAPAMSPPIPGYATPAPAAPAYATAPAAPAPQYAPAVPTAQNGMPALDLQGDGLSGLVGLVQE